MTSAEEITFEEWFWNFESHTQSVGLSNGIGDPSAFMPCHQLMRDSSGNLGVDYILRFENLEEDWNNMFKELGYEPPKLPKKNTSKHKHYSEYFKCETSEHIKDFIYWKFKDDFKHFKYKFEENA